MKYYTICKYFVVYLFASLRFVMSTCQNDGNTLQNGASLPYSINNLLIFSLLSRRSYFVYQCKILYISSFIISLSSICDVASTPLD